MKTHKHLFDQVISFENLLLASDRARKGKSKKVSTSAFDMNLECNLWQLHDELSKQTYLPGPYREFTIYEYKKRLISAAPYRDRVVHHALCQIIEPLFDKTFIYDSYACRVGKGTHRAVDRYTKFARKNKYVLKCDIQKYFPSIDHLILKEIIKRKIKDDKVCWLIDLIIDSSNPQEPVYLYFAGDELLTPIERARGIPIGNLTSQFFANLYLNSFDHFVKETLGCKYYIRYVDDFVVLSNDKKWLWQIKKEMENYLSDLRLKIHPQKCSVSPVETGIHFLGYRVYPDHRRLRRENGYRFQRKLKFLIREADGLPEEKQHAYQSVQAWLAHASHADTYGLQKALLKNTEFENIFNKLYGSW
ncbi:MAG: reverse transcriptase/maturase family protein [bacterium]|nr:reverse transcriptase/maturase family protein [bacterium]